MAQGATVTINITGNASGLNAALGAAQERLSGFGASLKSFGTKMTAAVSLPIAGIGIAAIKSAAEQEQLKIAFTTMLGSAEKASALIQDLEKFSASTPFQMPEVVSAGKQLLAFGVAAQDIEPTLESLGDLAAGVGAPLGDMAYLFGTAKAQGRLFMADINQFSNRGIPIIEALAATMGVPTTAIRKLVEEGKIGFPELEAAIASLTDEGGQFGGLMEAQSQSILGMWSTLKDNIGLTLTTIGNTIIETFDLRGKMGKALESVDALSKGFVAFSKSNPELFKFAVMAAAAAAAIGPLIVGLGVLAASVSAALPVLSAIGGALALLASPVALAVIAVGALAAAFWQFDIGGFRTQITGLLGDLGPLKAGLGEVATAAKQLVMGEIGFGEFASVVTEQLTAAADAVRAWAAGMDWGALLQGAGDAAAQIQETVTGWFQGVDIAGALGTAGSTLSGLGDTVAGWFEGIDWEGKLAAAKDKVTALGDTVAGWLGGIDWEEKLASARSGIEGIGATISGFVTGTDWAGLATDAQGKLGEVTTTVNGWRDGILKSVTDGITGIDWAGMSLDFAGFLTRLGDSIRDLDLSSIDFPGLLSGKLAGPLGTAIAGIEWVMSSENFGGLATAVKGAIDSIAWEENITALGGLLDALITQFDKIRTDFITDLTAKITAIDWTQLSLDFAGMLSTVSDKIAAIDWSEVGTNIGESIRLLFVGTEETQSALASLGTAVVDAIKAIKWGEVLNASLDLMGSLTQAVLDLVTGAINSIFGTEFEAGIVAAPQWVADLLSWLTGVKEAPGWVVTIQNWWNNVKAGAAWVTSLATWLAGLGTPPGWVATLQEWWAGVTTPPAWVGTLTSWLDSLTNWTWPTIQTPAWVGTLENLWGKFSRWIPGGNQLGTAYWQGGPTWVGEGGPELIFAPRGAQIMPHRASERYAAGAGNVQVTVNANVASDVDIYAMALQIQEVLRRGY